MEGLRAQRWFKECVNLAGADTGLSWADIKRMTAVERRAFIDEYTAQYEEAERAAKAGR